VQSYAISANPANNHAEKSVLLLKIMGKVVPLQAESNET